MHCVRALIKICFGPGPGGGLSENRHRVGLTWIAESREYRPTAVSRILSIFSFSWPYLRPYQMRLYGAILAGVVFGMSNAGILWLTKAVVTQLTPPVPVEVVQPVSDEVSLMPDALAAIFDGVKARGEALVAVLFPTYGEPITLLHVLGTVFGLPLFVAIRSSGEYLSAYWMSWVGERMVNDLRVKVFDRLSSLSLNYFNTAKMGDMITRINGDTLMLQRCISHGVKHSVTDPVTIISVLVYLLVSDWQLTLSVFVLLPVCLLPVVIFGRKARKAAKRMVQTNVTQSSLIVEMLSAIRVVKAYGLEEREVGRFRALTRQLFSHTMRGIRANEIVGPIIETVSMVAVGALIVFVAQTSRSVPDMLTFFLALIMFYTPVKKLAKLHVLFEQTSVGVGRLMGVLSEVPEVQDQPDAQAVSDLKGALRFEQVSFAYGDVPVLRDVSLDVPRGMKLGIAGESGSGKSTLINLVFRFFDPSAGKLTLDGVDLRDVRLKDYRQLLALVSQDVVVFDQSVEENIASGRLGATPEAVREAARQAHASEFIEALDEGYDTRLGERGVTLSGGQRQRIAIARAFVRDAPILVLDEATAALDAKSEAEVQSAIDQLAANRTVICIAHRLSTLRSMDKIIVLDRGRIIEEGSYSELLQKGGSFAAMAARQGIHSHEVEEQESSV